MSYRFLDKINSPEDLKALPKENIEPLCKEVRDFLINITEKQGGHLASNLGVVELSVALHRVFSSPKDRIIFDVGHQAYVHKLFTGRRESFDNLRVPGGLSGFTKRDESIHDPFGAGHSSTSVSAALGFAEADKLLNEKRHTVAVIGDGAFTGGMVHEALNNCNQELPLVIILNENGMSISSNKGTFASYLSRFRASVKYQNIKTKTKKFVLHIPLIGKPIKNVITFVKKKIKSLLLPANYFEELGLQYIGPIDGNNYEKVEKALTLAKNLNKTVVVHVVTTKGCGYTPAEKSPEGYHSVGSVERKSSFHSKAADALIELGKNDSRIVAVTAAMGLGTGLEAFEKSFPERYYDVGIAEEHALTFSAGLAAAGLSPYVAIYSTFLQRGYDNIIHDIALQKLPVRILIDRAGLSLGDGATHHGIFDVSFLMHIPGIQIFAPISYSSLKEILVLSAKCDRPVAIRYPNSTDEYFKPESFTYHLKSPESRVLVDFDVNDPPKRIFITYGKLLWEVDLAKSLLKEDGIESGIMILETLTPCEGLIENLKKILSRSECVLIAEEGIKNGGLGVTLYNLLGESGFDHTKTKIKIAAIDGNFASPSEICDLYSYVGLSANKLYEMIK